MRMRGWLAAGLLMPVLALTAGLYVVPLGVYLVNGFHRFKDGRILPVWTLDTYVAFFTDAVLLQDREHVAPARGNRDGPRPARSAIPSPTPSTRGCGAPAPAPCWP